MVTAFLLTLTTIPSLPPSSQHNKSEILYGVENAVGRGIYFMSNVKKRMDIFFDHHAPSIVVDIEEYRNGYIDIRKRGGKIRAFTEINKDNVKHCKELMKLVDELRHLDGVRGGVAVSESEYMATTLLQEAKPLTQVIYSNVKEVVEQGQYIFDTLWNAAIPSERKIREIEEGVTEYETKLIQDNNKILNEIVRINQSSNEFSVCATAGGMQYAFNYLFEVINQLLDRQRKGEHKGIRYISIINRDNLELAKILIDRGVQLKHVKNLPPMSFGVSDKEMGATLEKLEEGNTVQSLLISNEPLYIKHFASIFEELWKKGIDAADRIRDIEEGIDSADIEIIPNPKEGIARVCNIIKSAEEEVSIMFSSVNALRHQIDAGGLQLLKNVSEGRGTKVRLLIPDDSDEYMLSTILEEVKSQCPQVDVRSMDKSLHTRITIALADRKECIITELKDGTNDISYSAAGLSTYSQSKSIVSSYISIFESLWKQTELYEQLKVNDKMQKEFINVAAHELRTPIQPILGLSEILLYKQGNIEQYHVLLDTINRNAKRLQRLTEDILDVTKIESQSLKLNKQTFNLRNVIMSVLADHKKEDNNRGQIRLLCLNNEDIIVNADKERVTQVISNLLSNAIKFTNEGEEISIHIKRDNTAKQIDISIKDAGQGIDAEIYPRLFTKFATKSIVGTGLGLFISKKIIEAHDGRIWAENNPDGKGATFSFSLPIVEN
jgi:two-component system, OmpR family, sensor histidine kinase VicK